MDSLIDYITQDKEYGNILNNFSNTAINSQISDIFNLGDFPIEGEINLNISKLFYRSETNEKKPSGEGLPYLATVQRGCNFSCECIGDNILRIKLPLEVYVYGNIDVTPIQGLPPLSLKLACLMRIILNISITTLYEEPMKISIESGYIDSNISVPPSTYWNDNFYMSEDSNKKLHFLDPWSENEDPIKILPDIESPNCALPNLLDIQQQNFWYYNNMENNKCINFIFLSVGEGFLATQFICPLFIDNEPESIVDKAIFSKISEYSCEELQSESCDFEVNKEQSDKLRPIVDLYCKFNIGKTKCKCC